MKNIDKKRAKGALKHTIIAALVVALIEFGCVVYLMVKGNLSFMEAIPDSWIFSVKGIISSIGGLILFFFWSYFIEQEKEH